MRMIYNAQSWKTFLTLHKLGSYTNCCDYMFAIFVSNSLNSLLIRILHVRFSIICYMLQLCYHLVFCFSADMSAYLLNRSWDQFKVNETLFGVKSTFNEELYTTKLERGPQMTKLEEEALRIAREIEGEETRDSHLAEVWWSLLLLLLLLFFSVQVLLCFSLLNFSS